MAQMHPLGGPAPGTQSDAEKHLYDVLQTKLSDDIHVIHRVERFGKTTNGRLIKSEIDFLIIHPNYGVLVLEVKGGRIGFDPASRTWTTTNRAGKTFDLDPSPFQQATTAQRELRLFLKKAPAINQWRYDVVPAVWFFSMQWEPHHLAEFPDEMILDSRALAAPQQAIEAIFAYGNVQPAPGKLAPEASEALLARFDPTFRPTTLADEIQIDTKVIDYLTEAQCNRLDAMRHICHLAIPGSAGTGKTILAFETARMYARAKRRTLFLCVNEFQAQWLQDKADTECDVEEHFEIFDIKSLYAELAQRANINAREFEGAQIVTASGQTRLAQTLQKSIERLRSRASQPGESWQYQAIVVDEGQDIEKPLLLAISKLLRDLQRGAFYLFYDPEQRLDFSEEWRLPFTDFQTMTPLHDNLRNTRAIFDALVNFHPLMGFFAFNGPLGRPIEFVPIPIEGYANEDETIQTTLAKVIERLTQQEGIAPSEIMVVTCRTNDKSRWKQWLTLGDARLRALTQLRQTPAEDRANFVKISTIRAAKGLESNIVILVEPDGVAEDPRRERLLYVAISRAKHHLIVLGTPADIASHRLSEPDCGDC